jgi:hypothetical protein
MSGMPEMKGGNVKWPWSKENYNMRGTSTKIVVASVYERLGRIGIEKYHQISLF